MWLKLLKWLRKNAWHCIHVFIANCFNIRKKICLPFYSCHFPFRSFVNLNFYVHRSSQKLYIMWMLINILWICDKFEFLVFFNRRKAFKIACICNFKLKIKKKKKIYKKYVSGKHFSNKLLLKLNENRKYSYNVFKNDIKNPHKCWMSITWP